MSMKLKLFTWNYYFEFQERWKTWTTAPNRVTLYRYKCRERKRKKREMCKCQYYYGSTTSWASLNSNERVCKGERTGRRNVANSVLVMKASKRRRSVCLLLSLFQIYMGGLWLNPQTVQIITGQFSPLNLSRRLACDQARPNLFYFILTQSIPKKQATKGFQSTNIKH